MLKRLSYNNAWLIAFFSCFSLYLSIACYPYLLTVNPQEYSLLQVFYLAATQIGWLGLICFPLLLTTIVASFLPTKSFKFICATIAIIILIALKIDITVFQHYKFHINALLIKMFLDSGNEVFNVSWLSALIFITELFALTIGFGVTLWLSNKLARSKVKYVMISVWFALLLSSQAIHAWKNATFDNEVSQFTSNWPLYYPLTARSFIYEHELVSEEFAQQKRVEFKSCEKTELQYPSMPVEIQQKEKQPNVLFILVDAWRFDDSNAEIMPNVSKFKIKSSQFNQHMSGGNSTQAGIFSLFYSLPATYWNTFYANQVSPLFMDKLQESNYRMGIFGSAALTSPPLSRTVFKQVDNLRLRTPGTTQVERDARITEDFIAFQQQESEQPYFGFLFYDSAHGTEFPEPEGAKFKPYLSRVDHILLDNDFDPEPYHNRYKNSLFYIDGLIGKVLEKVDLDNTIVVITSDHGEEFNDNKLNYWGHTGNYSQAQIHVPLYVYQPNKVVKEIDYRTTHFDVVPTLMDTLFTTQSDVSDYSVGANLFDGSTPRDWFISGSYYNYALVGKETMLVVNPAGNSSQLDNQLQPESDKKIPIDAIQKSLEDMSRFYRK